MCLPMEFCCCCISLEVGAQIISIISTMLSTFVMVLYGATIALLSLQQSRMLSYAAIAASSGLHVVFGFLLSYGAFQSKPLYMWPWILLSWAMSAALMALSVLGTAVLVYNGSFEVTAQINAVISIYFVYSLKLFYFASVVNSRRLEIERETSGKVYMRPVTAWKYV